MDASKKFYFFLWCVSKTTWERVTLNFVNKGRSELCSASQWSSCLLCFYLSLSCAFYLILVICFVFIREVEHISVWKRKEDKRARISFIFEINKTKFTTNLRRKNNVFKLVMCIVDFEILFSLRRRLKVANSLLCTKKRKCNLSLHSLFPESI